MQTANQTQECLAPTIERPPGQTPEAPDAGIAAASRNRRWTSALLGGLVLVTTFAVGSVSPWLVPPYLAVMALLLADSLPRSLPFAGRRVIATNPAGRKRLGPNRKFGKTVPQAGAPEAPPASAAEPHDGPSSDLPAEEPAASLADPASPPPPVAEGPSTRPKRGKGGRPRKARNPSFEPAPATWVQVAPGKFVRVEGPSPEPVPYQSEPSEAPDRPEDAATLTVWEPDDDPDPIELFHSPELVDDRPDTAFAEEESSPPCDPPASRLDAPAYEPAEGTLDNPREPGIDPQPEDPHPIEALITDQPPAPPTPHEPEPEAAADVAPETDDAPASDDGGPSPIESADDASAIVLDHHQAVEEAQPAPDADAPGDFSLASDSNPDASEPNLDAERIEPDAPQTPEVDGYDTVEVVDSFILPPPEPDSSGPTAPTELSQPRRKISPARRPPARVGRSRLARRPLQVRAFQARGRHSGRRHHRRRAFPPRSPPGPNDHASCPNRKSA